MQLKTNASSDLNNRLLIVHYGGDMRKAYHLLKEEGKQEYFSHRYNLEVGVTIGKAIGEVAFLCCNTKVTYNEVLEPGLRAIGANFDPYRNSSTLTNLISKYGPTHLVVHFPMPVVFRWAINNKVKTIGIFADSFANKDLKSRLRHSRLSKILNSQKVDFVANHGLHASRSLEAIGVKPSKVIPWDFPYEVTPNDFEIKEWNNLDKDFNLLYVGSLSRSKGVGDILNALACLKLHNFFPKLALVGKGETEFFKAEIERLNLSKQVNLAGSLPHEKVIDLMRSSDAVIVPSRHEYPEGLPLTIYEALTVRTPLIISDHPMFCGSFQHKVDVLMFPEKDAVAMADCIETLILDPDLYSKLSINSLQAWGKIQIPTKWDQILYYWLEDSAQGNEWLFQRSLKNRLSRK